MDKKELKAMVAQLLQEMEQKEAFVPTEKDNSISDLTKLDLRQTYLVEEPADGERFLRLKKKTQDKLITNLSGSLA